MIEWAATGKSQLLWVIGLTLLCMLPFVDKAVHIDDPLFIWTAEQIRANPVDFYGFSVNWYGSADHMSDITKNPPLSSYYIAIASLLLGTGILGLHVAFMIPAAALAAGTYLLARRLSNSPMLAAFATVLTPASMVCATTLMCDTMMVCFWVWAVLLWISGIERESAARLGGSALLMCCAILTKYYGAALVPLLFVYSLLVRRSLGRWTLYFVLPVLAVLGYEWMTSVLYGKGLLFNAMRYSAAFRPAGVGPALARGVLGLIFVGGGILSALWYLPVLWSWKTQIVIGAVSASALGILILTGTGAGIPFSPERTADTAFMLQTWLHICTGVAIAWLVATDIRSQRDPERWLLGLWVGGTFLFVCAMNWTINIRTVLPMAPAVGILIARRLSTPEESTCTRRHRLRRILPLLPAALVALLVTTADFSLAECSRRASREIVAAYDPSARTVWFMGHWGFQYYMQQAGCKPIDLDATLTAVGDILAVPSNNTNLFAVPDTAVQKLGTVRFMPLRWLSTMSYELGAGFHASLWGPLPFVFTPTRPEEYDVFAFTRGIRFRTDTSDTAGPL